MVKMLFAGEVGTVDGVPFLGVNRPEESLACFLPMVCASVFIVLGPGAYSYCPEF